MPNMQWPKKDIRSNKHISAYVMCAYANYSRRMSFGKSSIVEIGKYIVDRLISHYLSKVSFNGTIKTEVL